VAAKDCQGIQNICGNRSEVEGLRVGTRRILGWEGMGGKLQPDAKSIREEVSGEMDRRQKDSTMIEKRTEDPVTIKGLID